MELTAFIKDLCCKGEALKSSSKVLRVVFRVVLGQYFEGGTSVCRNSTVQKIFGFICGGERAGSAADTIAKGWEFNHWAKPQIRKKSVYSSIFLSPPEYSQLLVVSKSVPAAEGKMHL